MEPMMGALGPQKPKKKRIRNWTAEDRAVHREFEKSRREAFSERLNVGHAAMDLEELIFANIFQKLTTLLPMLKTEQRPSKHIIVDASIAQHKAQQSRIIQAVLAVQELMSERDDLLLEVNRLRAICQPGTFVLRQAQPIDPAVVKMLADHNKLALGPVERSEERHKLPPSLNIRGRRLIPASTGASVPGHISHPPGHDITTLSPHRSTDSAWTFGEGEKSCRTISLPANVPEVSLLWTQSPSTLTKIPIKDIDSEYDTNSTHLIDDAALFWSQLPGDLSTGPPLNGGIPFSVNAPPMPSDPSMLWPPTLAIPNTKELGYGDTTVP
ncbi:uncharacterized protein N7477_005713 [Penicillium maclennaniae]|uniref:uncharacterized protein n=1 Tax=Penicillium maclennaniae TaxID=1343394 RepID=UPI002541E154|nr:uncharacterized protein N7477_005713 [Penicillium maclennaniae]KAJ5670350.1 hypothetical protein N7477_005713 [Penicillium maclennaniae]